MNDTKSIEKLLEQMMSAARAIDPAVSKSGSSDSKLLSKIQTADDQRVADVFKTWMDTVTNNGENKPSGEPIPDVEEPIIDPYKFPWRAMGQDLGVQKIRQMVKVKSDFDAIVIYREIIAQETSDFWEREADKSPGVAAAVNSFISISTPTTSADETFPF